MRTPRLFFLLLLPVLVVAACGDDGDEDLAADGGDTGAGADEDDAPSVTVPEGATPGGLPGDVFVSIEHVGGFGPVGFDFASVPSATVYADGTVVVPGATTAIFPGPAVAPLTTGTLAEGDLAELLAAAAEAGLLGEVLPDPGDNPLVADAASTRITVVVDGRDTVVEAYALELPVDEGVDGVTDEQREVRARLMTFVQEVSTIATSAATDRYEPTAYRVLSSEPFGGDAGLAPTAITWPAELPVPEPETCLALTTGDQAAAFTALLEGANQTTTWVIGDQPRALQVRPLLPHEQGC